MKKRKSWNEKVRRWALNYIADLPDEDYEKFMAALDHELTLHQLVKVKFDDFKEQKRELSPQLAEKSGSHLVTRVGNIVVLYRPKPKPEENKE